MAKAIKLSKAKLKKLRKEFEKLHSYLDVSDELKKYATDVAMARFEGKPLRTSK
jgi:hypothetical protein